MRKFLIAAAVLPLMAGAALAADSATTVLDRHVAAMKAGDLEGVLADYADNAVVTTPHGVAPGQKAVSGVDVFAGKANARKLFSTLTDKDHVPSNKTMTTRYEPGSADMTLMHWTQNGGTPKQVSGADIFVIRDGKILFQNVLIDPPKP